MTMRIHSVQIGPTAPLGPDGVPSGFVKHAVAGRIEVLASGMAGDEQADLTVHGGPEKAVYGYAMSHYSAWRSEYAEHADVLIPGAFGENLTIEGLDDDDIMVGDVHRIGDASLQVCQPRQPCFKLAMHFKDKRMPKAMVRSGRAGWYYRVLQSGSLSAGDEVVLVSRPQLALPLSRLTSIMNHGDATAEEIASLAAMPELASSLRERAQDRFAATVHGRSDPLKPYS